MRREKIRRIETDKKGTIEMRREWWLYGTRATVCSGNRNMNIPGVGTACGIYIQGRVSPPAVKKSSTMHRGVAI